MTARTRPPAWRIIGLVALTVALNVACGGGSTRQTVKQGVAFVAKRVAVIPKSADEATNIFNRSQFSQPQWDDFLGTARRVEKNGVTLLPKAAAATVADDFLAGLRADDGATVVTLIGHNSKGNFYFADGSSVALAGLSDEAPSKTIAAISCESAQYRSGSLVGVPTALTYDVAGRTEAVFIKAMRELADSGTIATVEQAQDELETALRAVIWKQRAEAAFRVAALPAAGGAGVGVHQVFDG